MTHGDSRDPDGIEIFRDGSPRRRQLRVVLAVVAVVAAVVVMLSATAVVVLRVEQQPQPPASRAAADAGVPATRPAAKVVVPVPSGTAGEPSAAADRPGASPTANARAGAPAPKDAVPAGAPPPPAADTEEPLLSGLVRNAVDSIAGAGSGGGIAVYPPKGTNPVKTGIVVPDDFPLPEGYVRYHQVTDDGRRLEPILMFSPDYEFVGPDGKPAAIPENRIVPPEMAPPGLTVRMLDVPAEESSPAAGR